MSGVGALSVQKAIYAKLNGDATLTALGVTGVFDAVPDKQATPYVVIGDSTETAFRTFGKGGHEDTVTVHIWTEDDDSKAGFKLGLDIADRIADLLDGATLTVDNHGTSVLCNAEFLEPVREDDGITRHIVQRFRVVTQDV